MDNIIYSYTNNLMNAIKASLMIVSAGIILLHEKGKLDLSDKIRKYFVDLPDYCEYIKIINLDKHWANILQNG